MCDPLENAAAAAARALALVDLEMLEAWVKDLNKFSKFFKQKHTFTDSKLLIWMLENTISHPETFTLLRHRSVREQSFVSC